MKYQDLEEGDVLQKGDEVDQDRGDGYVPVRNFLFGAEINDHSAWMFRYRRPITEVCDHIIGYDVPAHDCPPEPVRKSYGVVAETDCKHCPDCGAKNE